MSVFKLALSAASLAMAASRHPVVRAGMAAAPLVLNEKTRAVAADGVLKTAYAAGKIARQIMPRR